MSDTEEETNEAANIEASREKNGDDKESDSSGDDSGDLSELDRYWPAPTSETFELISSLHSTSTTAFAFNNAGTRFVAGGDDHTVRIWDFKVLNPQQRECISSSEPCGKSYIKNLDYSPDDELILVVSDDRRANIVGKDGLVRKDHECPEGDKYLKDMQNTKGHTRELNDGRWHPKDKEIFITCSYDATVRIWDLMKLSQQRTVIKTKSPLNGLQSVPTVCRYSRDALIIAAGCDDGSVLMWDTRRKFITTSACIKNAHLKGRMIGGLDFSYSNNKLCTRSHDKSCKTWDLRQLKQALGSRTDLPTRISTDCSFSPDDKYVMTGARSEQNEPSRLLFLEVDSPDLEVKHSLDVRNASVVRSGWHPKINHIGYTCDNGAVFIAYDDKRSLGGLIQAEDSRGMKRKRYQGLRDVSASSSFSMANKKIITPHSLPMFREDQPSTSFAKMRQDPKKSYKPSMPS